MNDEEGKLGQPTAPQPPKPVSSEPEKPKDPNPLDSLFISPEEAPNPPAQPVPGPDGTPEEAAEDEDPALLEELVEKITKAIDRLAKRGLNMRAVVALLHDANPSVPKKQIKTILESLRTLPEIYGRETNAPSPGRRRT